MDAIVWERSAVAKAPAGRAAATICRSILPSPSCTLSINCVLAASNLTAAAGRISDR